MFLFYFRGKPKARTTCCSYNPELAAKVDLQGDRRAGRGRGTDVVMAAAEGHLGLQ